jgi:ubiquinol-cytochrome c reductase cytochrome c1 subunit
MRVFAFLIALLPGLVFAAGPSVPLLSAPNDLRDTESLQRGAKLYVESCQGCHALQYLRYNRMSADLGISDEVLKAEYMLASDKPGDPMYRAMPPADAERWFGVVPPDLTLVARSRGTDWLYTYMLSFYEDPKRPFGVNNTVFPDVGMPHVLWNLEGGISKKDAEGKLHPANEAKHKEYEKVVTDLVNFLEYAAEPVKIQRQELGKIVLFVLFIFTIIAYILKREYWRDIK